MEKWDSRRAMFSELRESECKESNYLQVDIEGQRKQKRVEREMCWESSMCSLKKSNTLSWLEENARIDAQKKHRVSRTASSIVLSHTLKLGLT